MNWSVHSCRWCNFQVSFDDVPQLLTADMFQRRRWWQQTKQLQHGSLVCLWWQKVPTTAQAAGAAGLRMHTDNKESTGELQVSPAYQPSLVFATITGRDMQSLVPNGEGSHRQRPKLLLRCVALDQNAGSEWYA